MASAKKHFYVAILQKYFTGKPTINALVLFPVLNKAKSLTFELPVILKIHTFTCIFSGSQPAIRPSCAIIRLCHSATLDALITSNGLKQIFFILL